MSLAKKKQSIPWGLRDILQIVFFSILLSLFLFAFFTFTTAILALSLSENQKFAFFGCIAYCSIFFSIYMLIIKKYPSTFSLLGFRRVSWKFLVAMLPLSIGLMLLNILVYVVTTAVFGEVYVDETELILNKTLLPNEYALVFLVTVIIAPIVEEILFRGVLLGYMQKKASSFIAVLATSAIFGILHVVFPPLFVMGIVFAIVRIKTQSLYPSIFLHALNNTLVFSAFLISQQIP